MSDLEPVASELNAMFEQHYGDGCTEMYTRLRSWVRQLDHTGELKHRLRPLSQACDDLEPVHGKVLLQGEPVTFTNIDIGREAELTLNQKFWTAVSTVQHADLQANADYRELMRSLHIDLARLTEDVTQLKGEYSV